jgi:hypothetical protein
MSSQRSPRVNLTQKKINRAIAHHDCAAGRQFKVIKLLVGHWCAIPADAGCVVKTVGGLCQCVAQPWAGLWYCVWGCYG